MINLTFILPLHRQLATSMPVQYEWPYCAINWRFSPIEVVKNAIFL